MILATLLLLILPAMPPFAVLLPVDQTLLLLAPALATCAVLGWRAGGRLPLAVAWSAFAVWVLWLPATGGTYALLVRGWAILLAASFGGVVLLWRESSFLPRALLAIAIALGLGIVGASLSGGLAEAGAVFGEALKARADLALDAWQELTTRPEWVEFSRDNPGADALSQQVEQQFTLLPEAARLLVPAMLALESLAVLALAWTAYHRFGRARLGPPLAPLAELRFHDAFVWGIIAGLLVLVVPMPDALRLVGVNAMVFAGVLYVLRGLGVLLWFLKPGRWLLVLWTIFLVLFLHVVGAVALAIGVGDTWLDWRRRPRPKT